MQYNVQKNYFRCTNYQCSTKIHGFSPLPFNYHKEDIRKLLLIYANFCNDIPIFCASKNLPISKYEISRWYSIFRKQMSNKILMEMVENTLKGFVQIDERHTHTQSYMK